MIINQSKKFIFVHIPKTAGSSLTDAFAAYSQIGDLEIGGTPLGESHQWEIHERFGLHKHSKSYEIAGQLGHEKWNTFFRFAIVRNPYARAYSAYKFLKQWADGPCYEWACKLKDFEEFLSSDEFQARTDLLFHPQSDWIFDPSTNECLINFIGKQEQLGESVSYCLGKLTDARSIEDLPQMPQLNISSAAGEWINMYSEKSHLKDLVLKNWEADFDLLKYSKELSNE